MDRDQGTEQSQELPRVAFFGGSFDPPHFGHLAIARAARAALRLDTVLFAPVGAQPLKPMGSTAPFADRVAMTELAIAGEPGFELSLVDAPDPNGKPNYTLETLHRLRGDFGVHAALFFLMGADSFMNLRKWRGAPEIPFAATLIVASRPGLPLDDLSGLLGRGLSLEPRKLPDGFAKPKVDLRAFEVRDGNGRAAPFYLLPGLDVEISASAIRVQAQSGSPAHEKPLVPLAVSEYIRARGLYQ